jgi:SAM-dependent methyltransferase
VRAFWHPLSAIYLEEPRSLASAAVLRLLLAGEGRAAVVYAGDRMWPTVRHGDVVSVVPLPAGLPRPGEVVVAIDGGAPDLVRVVGIAGALGAIGDADPEAARALRAGDVLGTASNFRERIPRWRALRRAWLDVAEAWTGKPDGADDPAATVREKYDDQAPHYARSDAEALDRALEERLRERLAPGGRVLVAGCGAGRETLALEAMGFEAVGVDFSTRMIERALAERRRRGSRASFVAADLREHVEASGSLAGIVFTYDVYSFIPGSAQRIALLRRMRDWLVPGGALFLSARRADAPRERAVLGLQWAARTLRGQRGEWGDSHARRLDPAGRLRRSYVHVFSPRGLDREAARAGFDAKGWEGGHGVYAKSSSAASETKA